MKLIITLLCSLSFLSSKAQEYYLLVGTYDSPKSEGIYVYKFNSSDGSTTEISHVKISNPSFLAVSPDEKYVYAVGEMADSMGKAGKVSSFSFDKKTGTLSLLSQQSSEGNNPCYVTVDKTGNWVFAGNYSSGNFSILPSKNGVLGKAKQTIQHTGSGPDTARQKSPHVHGIFLKPDNSGIYVTDLGIDKIMRYQFDSKTGKLSADKFPSSATSPGNGPRHLDIHPNKKYLYLLNEMSGSIDVLQPWPNGDIAAIQTISALPLYYKGPAGSADIHVSPDGKFLYASNRGLSNTIAIFSIDQANGHLTLIGHVPSAGERPRNFNFDPSGKFLLVANQASDEITIFIRDTETGVLYYTIKRVLVGKPVCIKWISMN
ncbi:MAG: lactonase family protein [Chitinophagaceae bacterium]|nr:lactonase family protein [Chitinophagaceae bacterium]